MVSSHYTESYSDSPSFPGQSIVFIDAAVHDIPTLVNGIIPGAAVVLLDAHQDGMAQITAAMRLYSDICAIHIVSHGSPGCLYLGNAELSLDTLGKYATHLKTWSTIFKTASTSFPALLLYGCNVASGDAGEEFVYKLHQLVGASITASANRVGSSKLGGDWELEFTNGELKAPLVFSAEMKEDYDSILAADLIVSVTNSDVATPGEELFPIEVRVQNIGDTTTQGSESAGSDGYFVDLILSSDTEIPEGFAAFSPNYSEDVLLLGGRLSNTPNLDPGEEFVFTTSGRIPTDTPDGDYFIAAQIDPGQKVAESNEMNNTAFGPIQIGLNPKDNEFTIDLAADLGLVADPIDVGNGAFFLGEGIHPNELDIYKPDNIRAADTTNADQLWNDGGLGLNLDGAGLTVGIWEATEQSTNSWIIRNTHQELNGRVIIVDTGTGFSNHATHVAGTIGATGINVNARGMANQIQLRSYSHSDDTTEMERDASLLIASNHSYGKAAGWEIGTRKTVNAGVVANTNLWLQDFSVNSVEDIKFGKYDTSTQALDQVLFNNPNLLSVWSAGNARNDALPAGAVNYVTQFDSNPGIMDFNWIRAGWYQVPTNLIAPPGGDGNGGTGFDSLSTGQVAKNTLVVGAIENVTIDPYLRGDINIAGFSSWGPTDDGRVKPDVVANGVNLLSPIAFLEDGAGNLSLDASGNPIPTNVASGRKSGTSMAAPNVTGTAALLIQHYNNLFATMPRSATTKGVLIHTATDAGNVGPDYSYGWGLVNATEAANFLSNIDSNDPEVEFEETLYVGNEQTIEVVSDGTKPLKATIVWTDLPPVNIPVAGLDINTPVLVNDLDLWISGPDGMKRPWILDPNNPGAAAGTGINNLDNVEQVLIDAPNAGNYTIHVGHTGNSFSQNYSLFVSGLATLSDPIVDNLVDEDDGNLSSGDVSLREAIRFAKPGQTINFSPSLSGSTIALTQGELVIDKELTIKGLGSDKLTISGKNNSRIFNIDDGKRNLAAVRIDGLTIANGNASDDTGGGIKNRESLILTNSIVDHNNAQQSGGGISNDGTLVVTTSTISHNTVTEIGGGGISNGGTLIVNSSTINDNSAPLSGGGISSGGFEGTVGRLTVINSTLSNNQGGFEGGGIANYITSNLTVNNSTIHKNSADQGSGIFLSRAATTIRNAIIAQNIGSPDISGSFAGDHNLIGTDPKLGPLQDNGGPTKTHALLAGSPAIDTGTGGVVGGDQRGVLRPQGNGFDIGSFEFVNTTARPALDLTNQTGKVNLEFQVTRDAGFSNLVRFYEIDNATGTVNGISPGDLNYTAAALGKLVDGLELTGLNEHPVLSSATLEGGKRYAPVLFQNGSLATPFFSFTPANPDGAEHVQSSQEGIFNFEDLTGGGDQDFNDLVVQVKTADNSNSKPLPELLDLTGFDNGVLVGIDATLARDAGFSNILRFYATDAQGRVNGQLPGSPGYEDAVRSNLFNGVELQGVDKKSLPIDFSLKGGGYYGLALAVNGNLNDLVTLDDAVSGSSARLRGSNNSLFEFEDSNDFDFNDMVLTVNQVRAV
jgi:hypothetical protein